MKNATNHNVNFFDIVRGRRSVREYDSAYKMTKEEVEEIIKDAIIAPSAGNLQPTRYMIIHDEESKNRLYPIANHQAQVKSASVVIAILGDLEGHTKAEEIYGEAAEKGYMTHEVKNTIVKNYSALFSRLSNENLRELVTFDAGLATMQLMLAARARNYETNPMSGFDKEKFSKEFGVEDRYVVMALVTIGKGVKPGHPTTRLPIEQVTFWYK